MLKGNHITIEGDRIVSSMGVLDETGVNYISREGCFYAPDQLRSWLTIRPLLSGEDRLKCRPIIDSLVKIVEGFTPLEGAERKQGMEVVEEVRRFVPIKMIAVAGLYK